jgi:hypothetical protein
MTAAERAAYAWATVWAVATAFVCVMTYLQPNRNRITQMVNRWSERRATRFDVAGRPRLLMLAILFSLMAIVGIVLTSLGMKF